MHCSASAVLQGPKVILFCLQQTDCHLVTADTNIAVLAWAVLGQHWHSSDFREQKTGPEMRRLLINIKYCEALICLIARHSFHENFNNNKLYGSVLKLTSK